jgi:hypothetical protein
MSDEFCVYCEQRPCACCDDDDIDAEEEPDEDCPFCDGTGVEWIGQQCTVCGGSGLSAYATYMARGIEI